VLLFKYLRRERRVIKDRWLVFHATWML
jgi:hypothetical protein